MSPERRNDPDMRTRLAAIQEGYLRISRWMLIAFVFQTLVLLGTAGAFTILLRENAERADENAALAADNRALIAAQADERRNNARRNCEDVNQRHDAGVEEILRLRDSLPPTPEGKANAAATIALVDKLTPKRDCVAYAREQVKPVEKVDPNADP